MNLPQLTAEASLYQSGTHYRTNARTTLARFRSRTIRTAQEGTGTQGETGTPPTIGNETITVRGTAPIQCPPGYEQQGNQCIPINALPSGGTQPSGPGGKGSGGSGSGTGKNKGNGRDGGNYNPALGGQCCGGDLVDHGIYQFGFDPANNANDFMCCQYFGADSFLGTCVFCDTKNGASTSCKDGWCPSVG
jgi:hypothetical protein